MADVNPLSHRYYLADLERSAKARPRWRGPGTGRQVALRLIEATRRLVSRPKAREAA